MITNIWRTLRSSLSLQIVVAVVLGILLGLCFPSSQLKELSEIGKLLIHWVKLVAGPFLFLTVVAAIVEVQLKGHHALRLLLIAIFNTSIAIGIGMGLAYVFLGDIRIGTLSIASDSIKPHGMTLELSSFIKTLMPSSFLSPFLQNDILLMALLALIVGVATRSVYQKEGKAKLAQIAQSFERLRAVPEVLLRWLSHLIPFAVLSVIAGSISEHGLQIFFTLGRYVCVVLLGFAIQILLVYGFWIFGVARLRPKVFFKEAKAPVLYAIGVNSSLATLPLTMKALKNLGVSGPSASLGAGVATNLNNDGIVLYEAMAVFFITQLLNIPLSESQMLIAALACIVASMGITGVPEAGFISLSVVVSTLGLPVEALPLLLSVDWMIARGRSVVNVLSDMTLSISMDATEPKGSRKVF